MGFRCKAATRSLSLTVLFSISLIFILNLVPTTSFSSEATLFDRTFIRGKGAPVTERISFEVPSPAENYVIRVKNGNPDGTNRCSSAEIKINGIEIFGPSDFNQQVFSLTKPVQLDSTNLLEVTLKSIPDSFINIKITGIDSTPPHVAITTPKEGDIIGTPVITVTGTIDDPKATVDINGIRAMNSGATYQGSIPLSYASNTIAVEAKDFYGNISRSEIRVIMDNIKPVITIDPVTEYTSSQSIEIKGKVEDLTATIVTIQGKTVSIPAGGGTFSIMYDLSEGPNTISVAVKDSAGNTSEASCSITLDTTDPELTVSTLSDGSWTNNEVLNVAGKATDNTGIQQLTVNDAAVTMSLDGSFSYAVTLRDGPNTISVKATDLVGNEATDIRTINLDRSAPDITIRAPADNLKTRQSVMDVTGTIGEQAAVAIKINDGASVPAQMNGNDFSLTVTLVYELNTIEVTATDLAGNTSTAKRTVTFDDRNPSLSITDPAQDIKTNKADMIIKGEVDDFTAVSVTLTMDGTIYTPVVTNGKFEQPVAFTTEKTYQIYIKALDEAGNETNGQRNIVYDITAPAVTLDPVTSPTNLNNQVLTGTMEAGATVSVTCFTATVGEVTYPTTVTWTAALSNMQEGDNVIAVSAMDEAGNTSPAVESAITVDMTQPTITLDPISEYTSSLSIEIKGQVQDLTSTTITVQGKNVSVPAGGGTFSVPYDLTEGTNAITVTAKDDAGNISEASRSVTLDTIVPVIKITLPLSGQYIGKNFTAVSGTVSDATQTQVMVNGFEASVSNGTFTIPTVSLSEGSNVITAMATDSAGNTGTDQITVIADTIAPTVTGFSLKADPKVTLLIPISIIFSEATESSTVNSSNIMITGSAGAVDGSFSISGTEVVFTPYADFPANQTFTLSVSTGIKDKAGNNLASSFTATFDTIRGPSFILGEVYDDTLGLLLEGAEVRILKINNTTPDPMPVLSTDAMGRFSFEYQGVAGDALLEVKKDGYTKGIRNASLNPNKSFSIFDVRLTPRKVQTISASTGGNLNSGDANLLVPPASLTQDTEISLTSLSQQGMSFRLPMGWSPIYGIDISPRDVLLKAPAILSIENIWSFTPLQFPPYQGGLQGAVVVAYFGDNTMGWVAGNVSLSGENIIINVNNFGQYFLLIPDTFPSPPPIPQTAGEPILPSVTVIPDGGTATVDVIPPVVFSQEGAQGITTVKVTTQNPIPSGTPVEAKITEAYELKSGDVVTPESFMQDITLYAWPDDGNNNTLSARFPTTPSRIYPIGSLYYGKIDIDIYFPAGIEKPVDNVIGDQGGTVTGSDGAGIVIPPSSLTAGTVFRVYSLSETELPVSKPDNLTFIGALILQMDGGLFKSGAFPQFIIPGLSASEGTKVIVARVEAISGKEELKAVATGRVASGKVSIERCVSTSSTCILSGRYAFYIPGKPFGFITGSVLKPVLSGGEVSGVAVSGAVLNVDNLPFKAVTDASGNFMILSLISNYTIKALESGTGQSALATGDIGDGETKNIVLNLSAINPAVISVVPSDKATNVAVKSQIKVTFSTSIDASTINTGTFEILEMPTPLSQSPIGGHISLASGNTMAVFTPDSELKANMSYRVRLSADIKDTFGNALIPFESVFTTAEVLGNEALPPGALKASMPDAEGYVTVKGGAGLTYGGATVLIINKTKNIVLTIVANEDGSFEGRVKASITDVIVVQVKDLLNNVTTLSVGLLQNPDGTAAVGSKGGTIYGPGGITAVIPEGAFDQTIAIQVTMLSEDTIKDVRMNPEMRTGGVFKVDTGGITAKKELKISALAPDWITPEHQILLTRVINIRGFDELTLTCPAMLKDGNIVSTSPPFDGVTGDGTYEIVSWLDPAKGTAYALVDTWNTFDISYMIGDYDFIFEVPYLTKKTMVITVPVNRLYNVDLKSLSGETLKTISIQGPPKRGEFVPGVIPVVYDPIPPTVFINSIPDGATGVLPTDNFITIEMSEEVDPSTVNSNTVIVKDSHGNIVEGDVYRAADGKTIVFVPKYGYKYNETYTITLNGVKDWGGNSVTYSSSFSTFQPEVIATIPVPFAMAIDKYKDYIVVKGDEGLYGLTINSLIKIIDVSDPYNPQTKSSFSTYGYIRDIKAFGDGTNDYLVAVGGKINKYGFLDVFNITDIANPTYREEIYLSWNPGYGSPPDYVPYDGGEPEELELIDTNAYVATYGIGVQAVDLTQVTPPKEEAQKNAIGGTITESSVRAIAKVRNNILAIKNGALLILSPQLSIISQFTGLNSPYSVTGVEAFPVDLDGDRNYGKDEDNDGDAITSAQEIFDLAFVSTTDGIVVIDISNPSSPTKMDFIPIKTGKVVVDRERRMAFGLSEGLAAISLKGLKPPTNLSEVGGLRDSNGDGIDDRLLYTVPEASGMDIVISDEGGSLFAYVADYAGGVVKVVKLNKPELKIALVDENGMVLPKDYKIQIHNNSNGDPEMPVLRARIMPVDPKDINQFLYTINPELIGSEICWNVKVEYIVPLSGKHAYKSRNGLEPSGLGTDGFILKDAVSSSLCEGGIKGIGPELNISYSGTNTWGGNFGGGKLTITASILKNKAPTVLPHNGTIEGERTTDQFRTQMITYLKQAGRTPPIETELGSADILFALACVETYGINHFWPSIYGKPKASIYPIESSSGDGGFGVMQLTEPSPSYIQIWHWKLNIDGGIEMVKNKIFDEYEGAKGFPERMRGKYPDYRNLDDFTPEQMRMDVYSLYRGGHYWMAKKDGWKVSDHNDRGVSEAFKAKENEGKPTCQ